MIIALKILFLIFLFIAIRWTIVNVSKLVVRDNIPKNNFIVQAVGLAGVIGMSLLFKDVLF